MIVAVRKTISGLLKLLYLSPDMAVSDEDLEWAVHLALEVRRRVKEGRMSKSWGCSPGKRPPNEPGMQSSRTSLQRLNSLISSTLVLVTPSESGRLKVVQRGE